jgi:transposase-like protein
LILYGVNYKPGNDEISDYEYNISMMACPYCRSTGQQVKVGFTVAGSQRYLCKKCRRKYVAEPKMRGYTNETRKAVIRLFLEGMGLCEIGRALNINHQTIANWVNDYVAQQPPSICLKSQK